jgi:hypothetical protein
MCDKYRTSYVVFDRCSCQIENRRQHLNLNNGAAREYTGEEKILWNIPRGRKGAECALILL